MSYCSDQFSEGYEEFRARISDFFSAFSFVASIIGLKILYFSKYVLYSKLKLISNYFTNSCSNCSWERYTRYARLIPILARACGLSSFFTTIISYSFLDSVSVEAFFAWSAYFTGISNSTVGFENHSSLELVHGDSSNWVQFLT